MASSRAWLLSLVMASGVIGGGAVALDAAAGAPTGKPPAGVAKTGPQTALLPSTQDLDAQIRELIKEDNALRTALAQVRQRLATETKNADAALRAQQARMAAEEAALRAQIAVAQSARHNSSASAPTRSHAQGSATTGSRSVTAAPPAATPPPSHATTGASGTSGTSGSYGGDDGGIDSHDAGGDG